MPVLAAVGRSSNGVSTGFGRMSELSRLIPHPGATGIPPGLGRRLRRACWSFIMSTDQSGFRAALVFPSRTDSKEVPRYMFNKKRNRTILVVDDERSDREAMCRLLDEDGDTVLAAADYWQPVAAQQQYQGQINLLLTAIALPGTTATNWPKLCSEVTPISRCCSRPAPAGPKSAGITICRWRGRTCWTNRFKPSTCCVVSRPRSALEQVAVKPKVLGNARGFDARRGGKSR